MFPAAFDYVRAGSLEEAVSLLERYGGGARLLAGGHSLIPAMKLRLAQPQLLIDIGRLSELAYVRADGDEIAIGALTTHYALESSDLLAARAAALVDAARALGDVQVRNRGTIGGVLAHADPAADYPAVVLALGGSCIVVGRNGRRSVAIEDWFRGPFTTALGEGEVLTEVRLRATGPGEASVYRKFVRRASDYAMVGVAARLAVDGDGRCRSARVALTSVADRAYRATAVEDALAGRMLTPETVASAARLVVDGVDVLEDAYVPADYRAELARVETRRAVGDALARLG